MTKPASSEADLLLVGSIPGVSAEQVFRWVSESGLAKLLPSIPDGEIGERSYWITGQAYRVFNGHPDVETLTFPTRINGVENWKPLDGLRDQWSFKLKPNVGALRFGDPGWRLGYARDAIASYFVFRTMNEKGIVPPSVRFQVCLPLPVSTCNVMFRTDLAQLSKVVPGYIEAMAAEICCILEHIPASDLAIQFDSTAEARALGDPTRSDLVVNEVEVLSSVIPEDVSLGYHVCHGSLAGFFLRRPTDLGDDVRCMNMFLERSRRKVNYIHFPIADHCADSYYAPLSDLAQGKTHFFLGVIHGMHDLDDFRRRLLCAGRYIEKFGIGAPCGYGRFAADELPSIRDDHLTALRIFADKRR